MNKLIISVIVVILLIVGWSVLRSPEPVTYVADITDSVAALEAELLNIQAEVDAGTLSPQVAAAAQTRILNHITAINNAAASSERAELTPTQRAQLLDGLARLKNILVTYQATLVTVDESAAKSDNAAAKKRGGNVRDTSVSARIVDVIDTVESYAEEVINEYEPEDTLPEETTTEEYESIVEEASNTDEMAEETTDDSGTSTPDTDTSTNDDTSAAPDTADETIEDSTVTEIPEHTDYTMADVAAHGNESSCWTVVNGNVYDLTSFIGEHPGGDRNILKICGIDGTDAFTDKHGGESRPESTLEGFYLGPLN